MVRTLGCRAGPEADRSDLLQHLRGVVHFGYAIELEGPAHFLEVRLPSPCRQPSGNLMVSLDNSHSDATSRRKNVWKIDLRSAPGLPLG